nr:MAG TPA: hypothetical protein [Caudoviricetes sp.]
MQPQEFKKIIGRVKQGISVPATTSWASDETVDIYCDVKVTEEYWLNICGKGYGHTEHEDGQGYSPTYDELVIDTIDIDEVHAFLTADVSAEVDEFTAMQEAELIEALNKHITVEL